MTGKEKGQQAEAQAVIDEGAHRPKSKCVCVSLHMSTRVCPRVCVCEFEAVSMTRAQHLGPELKLLRSLLRHQGPMTNTQACTYISVCVCEKNLERHQEPLTESRCRGTKE